ncbi:hypothetical protein E0L35_24110 [Halomonas sp. ATBC28]|uniref:hypothetical protein n=1 Tax=Halomonas sp. ATBC28 TaxID=2545264 RepID=UPI00110E1620|nr:hypothetical protein [Halomonas sp. ATBC28]TMU14648.1 hypothetical protein E0L35_24110 [Halomonas sp. ATBC28]
MKRDRKYSTIGLSAVLALLVSLTGCSSIEERIKADDVQGAKSNAENSYSSILKLGMFATACSAPQVKTLLARDRDFDINSYPATLTPVQLATTRLVRAIKEGDPTYQTACLNTIEHIILDQRYKWREHGRRDTNDFIYLLSKGNEVDGIGEQADGYRQAVLLMLHVLGQRTDFSLNYRVSTPHGPRHARTAGAAIALSGRKDTWCYVNNNTVGPLDIEERRNSADFTPLLFAVQSGEKEMVLLLIGQGADYLVQVDNLQDIAAESLARELGHGDIRSLLIEHRQGRRYGEQCAN